ncbi:MAG: hypothetical protein OEU26_29740 [Candidatus Tectomicrobia bacterium]|nr:hypothetical protein [Candidatus Tectomicrobia bacterium]
MTGAVQMQMACQSAALDTALSVLCALSPARLTGHALRRRAESGHSVSVGDKSSVFSAA